MKQTLILIGAMIFVSTPIFADNITSNQKGIYIEANAGHAKIFETVNIKENGSTRNSSKNQNTGFGFNTNIGYQFNPHFGAEMGYTKYPDQDYGEVKGKNNYAVDLLAKGILPFDNGIRLFGKLGVARVHHELYTRSDQYELEKKGQHADATAMLSLGVGYAFTPHFSVNLQSSATAKTGNIPMMSLVSLGVNYLF